MVVYPSMCKYKGRFFHHKKCYFVIVAVSCFFHFKRDYICNTYIVIGFLLYCINVLYCTIYVDSFQSAM